MQVQAHTILLNTVLKNENPYTYMKQSEKMSKILNEPTISDIQSQKSRDFPSSKSVSMAKPIDESVQARIEGIKDMRRYKKKLTKEDLYFRKQDKLMQNAIIPKFERDKMTRKMHF